MVINEIRVRGYVLRDLLQSPDASGLFEKLVNDGNSKDQIAI